MYIFYKFQFYIIVSIICLYILNLKYLVYKIQLSLQVFLKINIMAIKTTAVPTLDKYESWVLI